MILLLSRSWLSLFIRGLFALFFGVATLVWPELSIRLLVVIFSFYVIADGVAGSIAAFMSRSWHRLWWVLLLDGLASLSVGLLAILWPDITALVLLYLIAAWSMFTGIVETYEAVRVRRLVEGEWLLAVRGILSIGFGIAVALFPVTAQDTLIVFIAFFAMIYGLLMVALALRVRSLREWAEEHFLSRETTIP